MSLFRCLWRGGRLLEAPRNHEAVIAYFNTLKLDVSDARTLFRLLDSAAAEGLSIEPASGGLKGLETVLFKPFSIVFSCFHSISRSPSVQNGELRAPGSTQVMAPTG